MNFSKPIIYASILHIVLLGLLLFSWQFTKTKIPAKKINTISVAVHKTTPTTAVKNKNIDLKPSPKPAKTEQLINIEPKPKQELKSATLPKQEIKPVAKPVPASTELKNKLQDKPQPKELTKTQAKDKPILKEQVKQATNKITNKTEQKPKPKISANKIKEETKNVSAKKEPDKTQENNNLDDDLLKQLIADSKNYQAHNSSALNQSNQISQINNQTTAEFDALIGSLVSERWIIPASATKGAQVEINITFNKGGTIDEVNVIKSSGNLTLDNSAVAAILSLGSIYEITQMTTAEFQLIQNRTLIFSPAL